MRYVRLVAHGMDEWDPGVWRGQWVGGERKSSGWGAAEKRQWGYTESMLVPGPQPPAPAADPHHETAEPPQSEQVYCRQ